MGLIKGLLKGFVVAKVIQFVTKRAGGNSAPR
jgi:hypothetical protein